VRNFPDGSCRLNCAWLCAALFVLAAPCAGAASAGGKSAYLQVGADRLYYETAGEGFPLVLVSGGSGMDLRQWSRVVPLLSPHFAVIAYDPRGIGRSDNPSAAYDDADDLVRLLDSLGVERAGLIGLSSAGGFVLEFLLRYPERAAGAVAAAPFVPGFEFSTPMLQRLEAFSAAARRGREPFLDAMFDDPHFIPAPLDPAVRAAARANMGANFDKAAGLDPSLAAVLDPPLLGQLSQIRPPVLLVAGALDHPEVLRRNRYLLGELPRATEQVVERAGHNAPLENPGAFVAAIRTFLESISRD